MQVFVRTVFVALAGLLSGCNDNSTDTAADPTAGAVLYAQAQALRPLRHDAVWTYRGHDFTRNTVFDNVVRHRGTAGAVAEIHSADPSMQLTHSLSGAGDVVQRGSLVLPWPGRPLAIDAIELRSPVRLNDRWTVFDGEVEDIGVDLDADHVNEGATVAVTRRVVGNEDITLPGMLPRAALRVDTHLTVALRMSGSAPSRPTERVLSTWYAPGIGPVRMALRSTDASREFDSEQLLVTWDGLTEGLGYLRQALRFPPGTGALAGTPLPPSKLALALEDGALVLTAAGSGYAVHRLDLRGALVATHLYPASDMFSRAIKFLRLRSGPRLASMSDNGVVLHAFTEGGERIGDAPVATFPGTGDATVAAVAGGDALWVAWSTVTPEDDFEFGWATYNVMMQRFAESGGALTAPLVVNSFVDAPFRGNGPYLYSLAASASSAVLTWFTNVPSIHFSMTSNEGVVPARIDASSVNPYVPMTAFSDGTSQWLGWMNDVIDSYPNRSNLARLGGDGRDEAGYLFVTLGSDFYDAWSSASAAYEGHLVGIGATAGEKFWPEDPAPSDWFTLRDLDATAPVLSTGAKLVVQVRVPSAGDPSFPPLLFADRALILDHRAGQLESIVVWRR